MELEFQKENTENGVEEIFETIMVENFLKHYRNQPTNSTVRET